MVFSRYISFFSHSDSIEELPGSLAHALKEMGVETDAHVTTEDEGWSVSFRHNGVRYRFCSRFDLRSEPLNCMGWVERDTGFLDSLFGPRETKSYPDIEPILQAALASLPVVGDVVWCSGDE